ncbi:Early nodulin-like protein [Thalictrum thalictroides]|uniref:Early nodulin-like protein n=1 Tax=Thalictrum thalictroides TaxID=46969 RepID=A0A7J6VD47_THATH|nr:Early nodulin-like protein [Thalictrum thalictroides]
MKSVGASEFRVGDSNGWTVSPSFNYNQWAEKNRFQVGDSLLFVYDSDKDSVYQVTKEDYDNCNTAKPIETYKDGHTSIRFYEFGYHYFISGNNGNCQKNEKMVVKVMAYRGSSNSAASSRYLSCLGGVGAFVASLLLFHIG